VQSRFQLPLHQAPYRDRIEFLALPSRRLISDTYWRRFTLIGQSLGSVLVAAEGIGLWGKTNGFWSDVFIGQCYDKPQQ
jgi:alpha-1,2-mannosyltransferase